MFEGFPNLHPLVVHLPIVLILLAAALQGLLVYREWPAVRWITLAVMAGGFAGAVAASTVFHALPMGLPPKAAAVFAEHEQFASYTTWLSGITLLLASIGFYFKVQRRAYEVLVLVAAVAAAGTLSVAGHRGAQLVYVEGVGPKGNLLDKSHGHGGSGEIEDMNAPAAGAHDEAAGQTEQGHGQEPGLNDGGHDGAPTREGGQATGMEGMNMSGSARKEGNNATPSGTMGDMPMPKSRPDRSAKSSSPAEAMPDMPGMNMPAAKKQSSVPEGMDMRRPAGKNQMADMPGMKGMDNMPGMDRPPAGAKKPTKAPASMEGMEGMGNMADMPNMKMDKKPSRTRKPAANKAGMDNMSDMPGMKKGQDPSGMDTQGGADMKGMPGMGESKAMPGMAMPSPMDKFRFKDNNPALNQSKKDN
ncbi:DUF2231 domain-containing protein [Hymenobacter psychrophilus]|uniref:Uncharacterized membrane protein n=1 Tax=Hymenobacter psychrophilus TaxID=651662 RepID=A0A1H3N5B6_9BACT|nr:DUF2231 domain-containing protein [Hymenobacter psychrophilus]SDY83890.1 Uncharacterized membrane protein [Hymenobacter psychrophilus]